MTDPVPYALVVPTVGRPSLAVLLESLARAAITAGMALPPVVVVDDRRGAPGPLATGDSVPVTVAGSGGSGPAAARNTGWRSVVADWIVFLDDDVVVTPTWFADLHLDLTSAAADVGGIAGRISVPLPTNRRPTDWERGTAGLETARWITADIAYRRPALIAAGGFDERFPRAFREDADMALRILDLGWQLGQGTRSTIHPVRPADRWASVRQQRGNADDVLMARLHGSDWRHRAEAPRGRRPWHLVTTGLGALALGAALTRRRRTALAAATGWAGLTGEFAWLRIAPGPRTKSEVATMLATSVAIPPAATYSWLSGLIRHRSVRPATTDRASQRPAAVLVDRDGTLVRDVPFNGDPGLVEPMPDARAALDRLRAEGIRVAVISNQSGVGRGLITLDQVHAVNARVEELLGPFDGWFFCPHAPADSCACRKPAPGLVHQAAGHLGVPADRCVVIGDIGADMNCAAAVGADAILVPTEHTRVEEIRAAPRRAATLARAVDLVLSGSAVNGGARSETARGGTARGETAQ